MLKIGCCFNLLEVTAVTHFLLKLIQFFAGKMRDGFKTLESVKKALCIGTLAVTYLSEIITVFGLQNQGDICPIPFEVYLDFVFNKIGFDIAFVIGGLEKKVSGFFIGI